jgi:hypothetical protein
VPTSGERLPPLSPDGRGTSSLLRRGDEHVLSGEHRTKLAVGVEGLELREAAKGVAAKEDDGEGRGGEEAVENGSDDLLVG